MISYERKVTEPFSLLFRPAAVFVWPGAAESWSSTFVNRVHVLRFTPGPLTVSGPVKQAWPLSDTARHGASGRRGSHGVVAATANAAWCVLGVFLVAKPLPTS